MIEQYVSDKVCRECGECKPASEFSPHPNTRDKLHTTCKACRREYANRKTAEGFRSDYTPKRAPKESPTAWILPSDPRKFTQKLLAATQRRWRYEVKPAANLVPSLGVAA